jgi:hypothetical protein
VNPRAEPTGPFSPSCRLQRDGMSHPKQLWRMALEDYRIRNQASNARKIEGRHHQRGGNGSELATSTARSCRAATRRSVCSWPVRSRHTADQPAGFPSSALRMVNINSPPFNTRRSRLAIPSMRCQSAAADPSRALAERWLCHSRSLASLYECGTVESQQTGLDHRHAATAFTTAPVMRTTPGHQTVCA